MPRALPVFMPKSPILDLFFFEPMESSFLRILFIFKRHRFFYFMGIRI